MTYWHEVQSSPQKDIWHWVGECNTLAQSIGLHRDPTRSEMDADTQRLRIRLWWSLYSRDRLIALALRRPTQINEGICDVPVLRPSDFDIRPFPPVVVRMLQYEEMGDVARQRRLAIMFIEKVKLCQCLGRVLFAQYSPSNHAFGATHKTTIALIPRQASEAELDRCNQKLEAWSSNLPKEAQFIAPDGQTLNDEDRVVLLHAAMLRMTYHATCTTLHRPRVLTSSSSKKPAAPSWTISLQKMQDAASGTADIMHSLYRLALTKFLPTSGLTVVIPAAAVHLTNLTSANLALRDASASHFRQCIEALHELKDMYLGAGIDSALLEKAARHQLDQAQISNTILAGPSGVLGATDSPGSTWDTRNCGNVTEFVPGNLLEGASAQEEEENVTANLSGDVDWDIDIVNDWLASSDAGGHQEQQSPDGDAQAIFVSSIVNEDMTRDFRATECPLQSLISPTMARTITGDLERDLGLA
jgi:hypothetical protein